MSGNLYVISAPSGAGKTSLVNALLERAERIEVSASHTTRPMRPGEVDGKDYHFVDVDTFKSMIRDNNFLEHAQVFDNFYGTSRSSTLDHVARGVDVILEIDWQGARQVREMIPDVITIFILPPSREALEERLRGRGQDGEEVIARRMQDAEGDMAHYDEFDYVVINDQFDTALTELHAIFTANRLRLTAQGEALKQLMAPMLA